MLARLRTFHSDLKARAVKYFRTREITRVLSVAHAQELANTPGNQWIEVKARQQREISDLRAGKWDIVDRRSWASPFLPESLHRLNTPILKNTPYNSRRFSETPVPRRAINLIKNSILQLHWKLAPAEDIDETPELKTRMKIGVYNLKHPNNDDSFNTLLEAVIEDLLVGGYGAIEPRLTPFYKRPFKMWAVDGASIRIFADWQESHPDKPRYAQMTGLRGERGYVVFKDDELIYIRDNVRSNTPFGIGKVEIAFNTINAFLGVQDMSARSGSDQIHKTLLWWKESLNPNQKQIVERHFRYEAEGMSKISTVSGMPKPEVIDVQAVTPEDLLLEWQEFLIRICAIGFDISPLALGIERDVNRNTASTLSTADFRLGVVPIAKKIEEAITRKLFHQVLGWEDIDFKFIGLEDVDALIKAELHQSYYQMDALTSDEIREDIGRDPIKSPLGRLTQSEKILAFTETQAKLTSQLQQQQLDHQMDMQQKQQDHQMELQQQQSDAQMQQQQDQQTWDQNQEFGGYGYGQGGGDENDIYSAGLAMIKPKLTMPKMPKLGATMPKISISGTKFSAAQIAMMTPSQVFFLMRAGALPKKAKDLKEGMEAEQPGVLITMSKELSDYLDFLEENQEEMEVKERPVSPADQKKQEKRFKERELRDDVMNTDRKKTVNTNPAYTTQNTSLGPNKGKSNKDRGF